MFKVALCGEWSDVNIRTAELFSAAGRRTDVWGGKKMIRSRAGAWENVFIIDSLRCNNIETVGYRARRLDAIRFRIARLHVYYIYTVRVIHTAPVVLRRARGPRGQTRAATPRNKHVTQCR